VTRVPYKLEEESVLRIAAGKTDLGLAFFCGGIFPDQGALKRGKKRRRSKFAGAGEAMEKGRGELSGARWERRRSFIIWSLVISQASRILQKERKRGSWPAKKSGKGPGGSLLTADSVGNCVLKAGLRQRESYRRSVAQ